MSDSNSDDKPQKKAWFKNHSLKVGDRVTNAAELTLKESLFPLFLVTILYFLWVKKNCSPWYIVNDFLYPGFCIWIA
jgi:chitodextrinase